MFDAAKVKESVKVIVNLSTLANKGNSRAEADAVNEISFLADLVGIKAGKVVEKIVEKEVRVPVADGKAVKELEAKLAEAQAELKANKEIQAGLNRRISEMSKKAAPVPAAAPAALPEVITDLLSSLAWADVLNDKQLSAIQSLGINIPGDGDKELVEQNHGDVVEAFAGEELDALNKRLDDAYRELVKSEQRCRVLQDAVDNGESEESIKKDIAILDQMSDDEPKTEEKPAAKKPAPKKATKKAAPKKAPAVAPAKAATKTASKTTSQKPAVQVAVACVSEEKVMNSCKIAGNLLLSDESNHIMFAVSRYDGHDAEYAKFSNIFKGLSVKFPGRVAMKADSAYDSRYDGQEPVHAAKKAAAAESVKMPKVSGVKSAGEGSLAV